MAGRRSTPGIKVRHRVGCPTAVTADARCRCKPGYLAWAFIRDPATPGAGRKVYRTFVDLDSAILWRGQVVVQARRDDGASLRPGADAPTIREAGRDLVAGMKSGAVRKRSGAAYRVGVIRSYSGALERHVYPAIGGRRLDAVSQPDLLELVERLQAAGLAPSTIKNTLDPVRVIFRRAVARGVVSTNPTASLETPTGEVARDRVADPVEAGRLVAALPRLEDRALWAAALFCGLRAGELRALLWRHVDLARATITVRESLPVDARGEDETTTPKTAAGVRAVPIPPVAHDQLTALRAPLEGVDDDMRVWPAGDGGPFSRTTILRRARAAWKTAKLDPIGLHEARHSAVSMWCASGIPVRMVAELAGHVSPAFTLSRYAHAFPTDTAHAGALFAAYLTRADTDSRIRQVDRRRTE